MSITKELISEYIISLGFKIGREMNLKLNPLKNLEDENLEEYIDVSYFHVARIETYNEYREHPEIDYLLNEVIADGFTFLKYREAFIESVKK